MWLVTNTLQKLFYPLFFCDKYFFEVSTKILFCDDSYHDLLSTEDVLFAVLIRDACPIRSGWVEIIIVTGKKLIIWNQNKNWV
jgi:hypothetical protein